MLELLVGLKGGNRGVLLEAVGHLAGIIFVYFIGSSSHLPLLLKGGLADGISEVVNSALSGLGVTVKRVICCRSCWW